MRIIPVIDLKAGIVVRGVGGRREEYRAVSSVLATQPTPAAVAQAFIEKLGLDEIYLADLDAIQGSRPNWSAADDLLALGARLWLDAGVADVVGSLGEPNSVRRVSEPSLARRIVGLESLADRALLPELLARIGPQRLTLSIDLKAGRPLAADPQWRDTAPEKIAAEALRIGVRSLIVLDLAYVGETHGLGVVALCSAIRRLNRGVELVSGGGVGSARDLEALAAAGCDAALVASALHDGRLVAEDLQRVMDH
jgi:phosphoribosylformimino-5-aminoimidazole carboxamide ribotide isomerase